jgi:hypothetical protein
MNCAPGVPSRKALKFIFYMISTEYGLAYALLYHNVNRRQDLGTSKGGGREAGRRLSGSAPGNGRQERVFHRFQYAIPE